MILSRTIIYGIQATLQLAATKPGCPVSCKYLAKQGHMPCRFLLQVLRNLVTHGVLESHRGIDGGYVLARLPDQITLLDIVEALDNSLTTRIPNEVFLSPQVGAKIFAALREATAAERDELRKLTIADLLRIAPPMLTPLHGTALPPEPPSAAGLIPIAHSSTLVLAPIPQTML